MSRSKDPEVRKAKYRAYELKRQNDPIHLAKELLWRAKSRQTRRSKVRLHLGGDICKRCGFTDIRALQIDHINGFGNKDRQKIEAEKFLSNILKMPQEDAQKLYQVLCANCNSIKRWEDREYASHTTRLEKLTGLSLKTGKYSNGSSFEDLMVSLDLRINELNNAKKSVTECVVAEAAGSV